MVSVTEKADTKRVSVARATLTFMSPQTYPLIQEGRSKKGDVIGVARVAGILAAKKTSEIIPLCHPISITSIDIDFRFFGDGGESRSGVIVTAGVTAVAKSGLEMEAMVAVTVAGLTIYDMCKAVDKRMQIGKVQLIRKTGGRGEDFETGEN